MTSGDKPALLPSFGSLIAADSYGDVLAAANGTLIELLDAPVGALRLCIGDRVIAEHWRGVDTIERDRLRALLKNGDDPAGLRVTRHRAGDLLLTAVSSSDTPPGSAAVDAANQLLDTVVVKLDGVRQQEATRKELTQLRRWFDIQDSQMRVLDRERQKFAAVVGQSDTLVFVADETLVARWANPALKDRLRQLGSDKTVGHSVQEIWDLLEIDCPPSGSPECAVSRVFRDGALEHVETRQHCEDGLRVLYLTVLPIRSSEGTTVEVLVMVQDLSDLDLLRRSESRYRLLFERSPDAMVMVAPETGRLLLGNAAASRLTGYSTPELLGLTLEEIHHPDDWIWAQNDYARIVGQDTAEATERQLRDKSGGTIVAKATASRFDLDGEPVTLLVLQDVTKQRQLEAELRHSQKMEAIGRLAAGITHEFNNLVTVILAEAELLKLRSDADPSLLESAENTEKAAMRAALLTRKLLSFSRKEVVKDEVLDLNEAVRNIEGMLRDLLGERNKLQVKFSTTPCLVRGDRSQLEEIAINLTANARDALSSSGGSLWLEVTPQGTDRVGLFARDDGTGMEPETKDRLFEPFFTTKAPHAGTGLGMTTIHRIVQRLAGTIEIQTEPGSGTTFQIQFPRVDDGDWSPRTDPSSDATSTGEERILVVDDVAEVRKMAARLLRLDGYDVDIAGSAKDALALCESAAEPYHLLLTDVVMPGMTGGQLSLEMQRRFPETRILFMSGYTDEEVVQHGVSNLNAEFLRKPFDRSTLSRKVRESLDQTSEDDSAA